MSAGDETKKGGNAARTEKPVKDGKAAKLAKSQKLVKSAKAEKPAKADKQKKARPGEGADTRTQYAALPWRLDKDGRLEILLATSRDTRRWVIPKGWPMKGRKPHIVATIEAMQEAGLHGVIEKVALGDYHYRKRLAAGAAVECRVEVYALQTQRQRKNWPEKKQRATHWFAQNIAAELVDEPELRALIRAFTPGGTATSG